MGSRTRVLGVLLGCTIVISMGSTAFASATALDPISVLSTSFDDGAPMEFSGITTTEGVQGYAGVGSGVDVFGGEFLRNADGGQAASTLTLTSLPAHDAIDLRFLLAVIDSWDGEGCFAGPDLFNVTVDGETIFSEIFENSGCGAQSYVPPDGVELARRTNLGFGSGGFFNDSAYDMGLDPAFNGIAHSGDTLTIQWFGSGTQQGGNDESWAIENLEVIIHPADVTSEPPTDDPGEVLPDDPAEVTPEVEGTVEVAEPEVVVLPRRLARTDASPLTPWLLGLGLGSLGLGVTIRRRATARG